MSKEKVEIEQPKKYYLDLPKIGMVNEISNNQLCWTNCDGGLTDKLKEYGAWCTECHDINEKKDRYVKAAKVRELLEQLDEPQDEKVEAHLAEHWDEDTGDVLWWNFPVEEPPYCGTPLDEHFPKYKTHFTTIDMPNEIEQPKRWVVMQGGSEVWYLQGFRNSLDGDIVKQWCSYEGCIKFTDRKKAEAVATLVDGSVEEV